MPNLELQPKRDISAFRKISLGTWRTAYDSQVYGTMEMPMERAMEYIHRFRQATGKRLTVTHLVAKALAETLHNTPDANAILRYNRIYLRKRIGIFLQVAMADEETGKVDLSGATIYDLEKKSLLELVDEVERKVSAVRKREDPALESSRGLFQYIPFPLLGWALRTISFFSYTLNLDLTRWGIPNDPFGSAMVTNIGSMGLDVAYVPLIPFTRVPIILATGAVKEVPVAEEGKVVTRRLMKINATFDHRFIDGFHAAAMSKVMLAWLSEPYKHFGPIPEKEEDEGELQMPVSG